jgi:hypothetical protein
MYLVHCGLIPDWTGEGVDTVEVVVVGAEEVVLLPETPMQ